MTMLRTLQATIEQSIRHAVLPGQMTVAQLRDYLDAAGVDYRTRDRKEHLAYMARQVRYERDYVARGNAAGERDTGSMRAFQGGNADGF